MAHPDWKWNHEPNIPPELRNPSPQQGILQSMKEAADQRQVGGDHYKTLDVSPWDVMEHLLTEEEFIGFLKGNIIKYSIRQGRKAGSNDDGQKCLHYIQKLKEITSQITDQEWTGL
jgi:hypothetical protein